MTENQENEKKAEISWILLEIINLREFECTNPYVARVVRDRLTLLDGLLENIQYGNLTFNKSE